VLTLEFAASDNGAQEPNMLCAEALTKSCGDGRNWSMLRNSAGDLTFQTFLPPLYLLNRKNLSCHVFIPNVLRFLPQHE